MAMIPASRIKRGLAAWTLILVSAAAARATVSTGAVPGSINYQGHLENNGTPVTATLPIDFQIYDALTGGNLLWAQGASPVAISQGVFGVSLAVPVAALSGTGAKYLQVVVNTQPLSPREPIQSVAYAYAAHAVEAGAIGDAEIAPGANLSPTKILVSTSATVLLSSWSTPSGQIDASKISGSPAPGPHAGTHALSGGDSLLPFSVGVASLTASYSVFLATAGGSVGIGTATPASRLHIVDGDLRISSAAAAGPHGIYFQDGTFLTSASLAVASGLSNTADAVIVSDSLDSGTGDIILKTDAVERARLLGSLGVGAGNFGVGTSGHAAVQAQLHVVGSVLQPYALIVASGPSVAGDQYVLSVATEGSVAITGALLRRGNPAYGSLYTTHVNLGVASTTGASGANKGYAAVGGGFANAAAGAFSTVPGGSANAATGDYSFAAGNRAKATAQGSILFADSQAVDLLGTTTDQFLVRAQGGFYADASSVTFAHAGTPTLFISSSNFIGVGTTSPAGSLHVASGQVLVGSHAIHDGTGSGDVMVSGNLIVDGRIVQTMGLQNVIDSLQIATVTATQGPVFTVGVGTLTVTGAGNVGIATGVPQGLFDVGGGTLVVTGGRVGIGTASPAVPLHVVGAGLFDAASFAPAGAGTLGVAAPSTFLASLDLYQGGTAPANRAWRIVNDEAQAGAGDLRFRSLAGDQVAILQGGNVGLGTTSPATRLHVSSGVLTIDGSGAGMTVGGSTFAVQGSSVGIGTAFPAARLHVSSGTILVDGSAATSLAVNGSVGIGTTAPAARLHLSSGTIFVDGISPGLKIGNGQFAVVGGSVAVNTLSPNSVFEVNGDIRISNGSIGQLIFADGSTMNHAGVGSANSVSNLTNLQITADSGNSGTGSIILLTGSNPRLYVANNGRVGIANSVPAAQLQVSSGGAVPSDTLLLVSAGNNPGQELVTFKGDGKVGFGTTSPQQGVHISSAGAAGARLRLESTVGGRSWEMVSYGSSHPGAFSIFDVTASTDRFVIDTAGDVGLGFGGPANRLDVNGSEAVGTFSGTAAPANSLIVSGSVGVGVASPASALDVLNGAHFGGTVGIGTAPGPAALTLNGDLQFAAGKIIFPDSSQMTSANVFTAASVSSSNIVEITANTSGGPSGAIYFVIANTTAAAVATSGNVGISTANPQAPLDVNGRAAFGFYPQKSTFTASGSLEFASGSTVTTAGTLTISTATASQSDRPALFVDGSGRVGIGNLEPSVQLHLADPGSGNPQIRLFENGTNASGTKGILSFSARSAAQAEAVLGYIQGVSENGDVNGGLRFVARTGSDVEVFRIFSGGGLSIGTTLTQNKLDVAGGAAIGSYAGTSAAPGNGLIVSGRVGVQMNSPANSLDVGGGAAFGTLAGTAGPANSVIVGGKLGIGTSQPATAFHLSSGVATIDGIGGGLLIGTSSFTVAGSSVGIGTAFPAAKLHLSSGTILVDGNAANSLIVSGNVGIGAPVPASRLHVSSGIVTIDGTNGSLGLGTASPASKLTVVDGDIRLTTTTGSRGIIFQDGSLQTTAAGSSQWLTSGANIYNGNTGNVGVGTSNPAFLLVSSGAADQIQATGGGSQAGGIQIASGFTDVVTRRNWAMRTDVEASGGDLTFLVGTSRGANPSSALMTLASQVSGVGILTTAPKSALDVSGGVAVGTYAGVNAAPATGLIVSGSVGIGTNSPSDPLTVNGNIRITTVGSKLFFPDGTQMTTASVGSASSVVGAGDVPIEADSGSSGVGDVLLQAHGANTRVIVKNQGNVGIGTLSPATLLHISSGILTVDGLGAGMRIGGSTFTVAASSVGIGTLSPAARLHLSSGTLLVDGNAANSLLVNGNVGVGTSAPAQKLHLSSGTILVDGNAANSMLVKGNVGIGTSNPAGKLHVSSGSVIVDGTGSQLSVNGTALFVSGFNVGIDTGTPDAELHVLGGNSNLASTEGDFKIGDDTNRLKFGVSLTGAGSRIYAAGGSRLLMIGNPVDGDVFAVQASSVGIGTASPGARLEVSSGTVVFDGNAGTSLVTSGAVGVSSATPLGALVVGPGNGYLVVANGGNVGIASATPVGLLSVGNTSLIVKSGGNVGIGTAIPQTLLHVYGGLASAVAPGGKVDAIFENSGSHVVTIYQDGSGGTEGAYTWSTSGAGNEGAIGYISSSHAMRFTTNLTERMRITGSGNVGIGSAAPANLLVSSGTSDQIMAAGGSGQAAGVRLSPGTSDASHRDFALRTDVNQQGDLALLAGSLNSQGTSPGASGTVVEVSTNNYVGIGSFFGTGSNSPQSTLDVSGGNFITFPTCSGSNCPDTAGNPNCSVPAHYGRVVVKIDSGSSNLCVCVQTAGVGTFGWLCK